MIVSKSHTKKQKLTSPYKEGDRLLMSDGTVGIAREVTSDYYGLRSNYHAVLVSTPTDGKTHDPIGTVQMVMFLNTMKTLNDGNNTSRIVRKLEMENKHMPTVKNCARCFECCTFYQSKRRLGYCR